MGRMGKRGRCKFVQLYSLYNGGKYDKENIFNRTRLRRASNPRNEV